MKMKCKGVMMVTTRDGSFPLWPGLVVDMDRVVAKEQGTLGEEGHLPEVTLAKAVEGREDLFEEIGAEGAEE